MTQLVAAIHKWLAEQLIPEVANSVERLRKLEDVRHIAIMPDVHLAQDVCVGAVIATEQLIYPSAVGNDIGCGMAALAFDGEASALNTERSAGNVLAKLYEAVPSNKHRQLHELPDNLVAHGLSDQRLQNLAKRDARVQLGTLGRGNHFLEFQSDQEDRLWIMVHSGSRAIGQAIANRHLDDSVIGQFGLKYLDSKHERGKAYLADMEWARAYAAENRLAMLTSVEQILQRLFGMRADWNSLIHCDHNHVQRELHCGVHYWVHRKGAQSAVTDEPGVVPGSMGSPSFHTVGRGCEEALQSCSHGAGRRMSRTDARQRVNVKELARQLGRVWFDNRYAADLREEAPSAYKDIRSVMRAQRDLVKIVTELRPLVSYKGR